MVWETRGKTILVTGATSGIGLELSVALVRKGSHVVMVGRNPARMEAALSYVSEQTGSKDFSSFLCDFASQADIRKLAESFLSSHDQLHVLVNNAGGVYKKRVLTEDGIESTFAVNHLGYFLLTNLLYDRMEKSAPARIVTVASTSHRRGTLDFDNLQFENGYSITRAYACSKLANLFFAFELARRLKGTGITSNAVHPGVVNTRIWADAPLWAKPLIQIFYRPFFISAKKGASYVEELVTRPDLSEVEGKYFEKGKMVNPSALAQNEELAKRLWEVSASLVGLLPSKRSLISE